MKKYFNTLMSSIKYKYFNFFSCGLLILWSISPVVVYILRFYLNMRGIYFFVFLIYFIGTAGIIEYLMYIGKKIDDKDFKIKDYISHILILILVILALISSIYAGSPRLSFFGDNYRKEGFFTYIMYVGFILSASVIDEKKYIRIICKFIIFSALFITIMPLFNSNFTYNFVNIYRNTNHYGYFIMIALMLAGFMFVDSTKFRKYFYLLVYIFLIYMLIKNNTFGCYLSVSICLGFSLIYSLIKKYKRTDMAILLIIFIVLSFLVSYFNINIGDKVNYANNDSNIYNNIVDFSNDIKTLVDDDKKNIDSIGSGRWILWRLGIDYVLENPIIGGGMECLASYYFWNGVLVDRPHNIIIQIAAFIGIPGAIIYLGLILYLAIINLKHIKKSTVNYMIYISAMCYFISSNFGNSMYYTSPYFMILLGFLITMRFNNEDKHIN